MTITGGGTPGDEFAAFCRRHRRLLERRFVSTWQFRHPDAADLAQEVLAALAARWDSLATEQHRIRSMWVLARNKGSDFRRGRAADDVPLDGHVDVPADSRTTDPAILVCRAHEPLWHALRALPATRREAVIGRVVHRMSYEELQAETGRTAAALRQDVSRGLARLRHALAGGERAGALDPPPLRVRVT